MEEDFLITFGGAVKSLGDGHIGGYLVAFTDAQHADLEGEYFDASTDFDFEGERKTSVYLNHRQPLKTRDGTRIAVKEKIGEGTLTLDADGVLIDAILFNAERYADLLAHLGWSSGSAPHLVEYDEPLKGATRIARWPLGLDASITPTPANPHGSRVVSLKSLIPADEAEPEPEAEPEARKRGNAAKATTDVNQSINQSITEENTMPDEITNQVDVAAIAKQAAEEAVKAYRATLENEPPVKSAGVVTRAEEDDAIKRAPFLGLGEFLMCVKNAQLGAAVDKRLLSLRSDDGFSLNGALGDGFVGGLVRSAFKNTYKQTGLNEGLGADGGFLVGTDRAGGIMERVYEVGDLLRRVDMVGVSSGSNGMTFNAVNETSRADGSRKGGIRAYWLAEGGTKTASQPVFRQIELRLHKVAGLVYATDELLQDANALESWIMRNLPEELRFVVEDSIINGTGVGMPLGVVPSGAVVSVAKEAGQAADTVVTANIVKMWSRMYAPSRRNAVWLVNQDVEPQLYQLSLPVGTGGQSVYTPPGGLSATPYATLMGRPVLPAEYMDTVGDQGDIMLADLTEYQMIEKGGVQTASSIHVNFIYDETLFRFVYRVDGQPKWNSPLTPKNSTLTQSPFIVLDARA